MKISPACGGQCGRSESAWSANLVIAWRESFSKRVSVDLSFRYCLDSRLKHRRGLGRQADIDRLALLFVGPLEIGAVPLCGSAPCFRTPQQVVDSIFRAGPKDTSQPSQSKPENKRVWASLTKGKSVVIDEVRQEVLRRDPEGLKTLVALTDGVLLCKSG